MDLPGLEAPVGKGLGEMDCDGPTAVRTWLVLAHDDAHQTRLRADEEGRAIITGPPEVSCPVNVHRRLGIDDDGQSEPPAESLDVHVVEYA